MARHGDNSQDPERAVRTLGPGDRIRKRYEYLQAQSLGRRVHTPHFLVMLLPRPGEKLRLGITVTRKASSSAVARNRVKRLVREVFRNNRDRFPTGCDVVFIARRGADALSLDEVLAEVLGAERAMRAAARKVAG